MYIHRMLLSSAILVVSANALSTTLDKAFTKGKLYADFNLRYESVDQDNALKDADALTLRTRLGFKSADYQGFRFGIEFEDSRNIFGVSDYNDTLGRGVGHSVVADPESTEVDQLYVAYGDGPLKAKLGRQVLTFDNHRFVGHVGWRQDRQTFDALTVHYQANKVLKFSYAFIDQRNRIFADERDIDARDHLFHGDVKTEYGTLTGYGYALELDDAPSNSLDTWGLRFNGKGKVQDTKILYQIEWATQDSESGSSDFDADYLLLEGGAVLSGITVKLGYEMLGSDGGQYGFSTPLATLHKFNGWADQFLATPKQGLNDRYLSVGGKGAGGKWTVVYHDFEADEETAVIDDLGHELDLVYTRKIAKHYRMGVKWASYGSGDSAVGKVDADKVWLWVGASFK